MEGKLQQEAIRARRYWTMDGLPDLVVGSAFVLYGGLLLSSWWWVAATFMPVFIVFGGRRLLLFWKARVSYPRTGYVRYPRRRSAWAVTFLFVLGLAAFIVWGDPSWTIWLVPLLLVLVLGWTAWKQRNGRYALYAASGLLLGSAAALRDAGYGWTYFWLGMVMLIGGGWQLIRYLRAYPPQPDGLP